MIKVNKGNVSVTGTTAEILTDLSCVSSVLAEMGLKGIDSKEKLKDAVLHAVEIGFEDDLEAIDLEEGEASELVKALNEFADKLADIFGEGKGEK